MSTTTPRIKPLLVAIGITALLATSCRSNNPSDQAAGDHPLSTGTSVTAETTTTAPSSRPTSPQRSELGQLLDQLIEDTRLPAVGVTSFTGDQILETEVAGVRRVGDQTSVEVTDKFSIGSNAKAMTATLVATLVDDGLISWDTTVADVYRSAIPALHPSWASITVRQLLSHTSGLDDGTAIPTLVSLDMAAPVTDQRLAVVATVTTTPVTGTPGAYAYSNVGYTVDGAMLEELTATSWEDLIQTRLFNVVGMDSCGFYAPGTPGQVDEPWGHFEEQSGEAMDPGDPEADFPPVIAPAGMIHCNMADWVRFLQSQLRGLQGSTAEIVSAESFEAIQTPGDGSDYALGWVLLNDPNGSVTFYHHGSNQRFTAEVWLVPGDNWGLITVTNIGETIADAALQAVDQAMFNRRTRQ